MTIPRPSQKRKYSSKVSKMKPGFKFRVHFIVRSGDLNFLTNLSAAFFERRLRSVWAKEDWPELGDDTPVGDEKGDDIPVKDELGDDCSLGYELGDDTPVRYE